MDKDLISLDDHNNALDDSSATIPEFDLISLDPQAPPSPPPAASPQGYMSPDKIQQFDDFIEEKLPAPKSTHSLCELGYYQTYFNIDTTTVLQRMKRALLPLNVDSFFGEETPDLYTPFWIATSLVFLLTVCGDIFGTSIGESKDVQWDHDAQKIVSAVAVVYGIMAIIPVSIYCALSSYGSDITLVEMVSLYGYSLLIFIPTCIICIAPIFYLRLATWIATAIWSLLLLFKNYWSEVEKFLGAKKFAIAGVAVVGHGVLTTSAILYFFS